MLATGRKRYATAPTSSRPTARSVVPIGRRMKCSEKLIASLRGPLLRRLGLLRQLELGLQSLRRAQPRLQAVHREVDHRRSVERQQLAQQQAANDGDAERVAQLRAGAALDRQRDGAE